MVYKEIFVESVFNYIVYTYPSVRVKRGLGA